MKISIIDEIDFSNNVHCLKYYFIKDSLNNLDGWDQEYDFLYWGGDKKKTIGGQKSGDERHLILKQIKNEESIKSFWIGRFSNFKRDEKFMKMSELISYLKRSKTTLCFNWMDNKPIS